MRLWFMTKDPLANNRPMRLRSMRRPLLALTALAAAGAIAAGCGGSSSSNNNNNNSGSSGSSSGVDDYCTSRRMAPTTWSRGVLVSTSSPAPRRSSGSTVCCK
jgi:hypothetical protein